MSTNAVGNLDAVNAAPTSTKTLGTDTVSRDDFLRLLVAQLKYQDPLNPVQNQEFVSQLATFSSLEQETNQSQLLQKLVDNAKTNNTSQAMAMIGKQVVVKDDQFQYQPGDQQDFIFNADKTGTAVVQVSNASGNVVLTDVVSVASAGQNTYHFNGKNSKGDQLTAGTYTISIGNSTDTQGNQTSYPIYLSGAVDGITYVNGEPELMVNGQTIPLSSVEAIYNSK